jgi:dephospho-CoA kinase
MPSAPALLPSAHESRRAMLRVGLTGGIACGKSTVATYLRKLDIPILDADVLAHGMLKSGQPAYGEAIHEFGAGILDSEKEIDRAKLGAIVFADHERLEKLNRMIHPRVMGVSVHWFASLDRPGGPAFAVIEAALLVEAGYRDKLNRLIVVRCHPDQQIERLRARGLGEAQALQRTKAQMPIGEKAALADDVIDTSGSLEETERQVRELVGRLNRLADARVVSDRSPQSAN